MSELRIPVPPSSSYFYSKYQLRLPHHIAISHKKAHPYVAILSRTNLQNCT